MKALLKDDHPKLKRERKERKGKKIWNPRSGQESKKTKMRVICR
jgi:hypothetical protein